jgi:hypothetical protein
LSIGNDAYSDIHVRVRADGWILAWLDKLLDDPASIVYTVAGAIGFPGYSMVGMYDFSEPSATRLLIFGNSITSVSPSTINYYYSITANSTMDPIKLLIRAGGYSYNANYDRLSVHGGLVFQSPAGVWGWSTYQIYVYSKGIQHSVTQTAQSPSSVNNVAFIMWSS